VAELYLGTSPGFQKTHVRNANSTDIYAAQLNSMDLPLNNDQWFDRSLLKANELTEIKGKDFVLKKDGQDWKLDGKDSAKLNSANAALLAKSLSGLRVDSLQATSPTGAPAYSLEVIADGKPLTYQFWASEGKQTVKRSDFEQSFSMSKPIYDSLVASNLAKLTEPMPEPAGAGAATPSPPGSPAATASPAATP
jgi:hypothetical protein